MVIFVLVLFGVLVMNLLKAVLWLGALSAVFIYHAEYLLSNHGLLVVSPYLHLQFPFLMHVCAL